jgi:hypothetical protein
MNTNNFQTSLNTVSGNLFSINRWYHVEIQYAHTLNKQNIRLYDFGNSNAFFSTSITAGPFSPNMNKLGSSDIRAGSFQVPGAQCTAYLDNVKFSTY